MTSEWTIGGVRDRAQIIRKIELALDHWEEHGFGRWIVTCSDEPIGTVKLETWLHDGQSGVLHVQPVKPDPRERPESRKTSPRGSVSIPGSPHWQR